MGITGLIPFLEKASTPIDIRRLEGSSVAVDSYCWLHKGVFACAEKLVRGEETDVYINYCLKFVDMLTRYKIKTIMVFDGRHLPAKAETERRRREARHESRKLAKEYLRKNDIEKARSHMRRAVDVTHEMALRLIKVCRDRGVECIVAPYEADAQMAWLNIQGLAEYIITEDSDLTLFGARKVLFKLDIQGNALLVENTKLHLAMGCKPEKYTFDKFRRMCILSGCDYLDSLQGIGLKKACKFILTTEEDDMTKALKKMPQYLKMKQLDVSDKYIDDFFKAEATFRHMFIYNPLERRMERLHELDEFETDERHCSNAGTLLEDNDQAFQLALGNLNPFTLKQLDDWHPDRDWSNTGKKKLKSLKHKSIWKPNSCSQENEEKKSGEKYVGAIFKFKKIQYKHMAEMEIEETLACEKSKLEEAEVFSMYSYAKVHPKRKRCPSDSSDSGEETASAVNVKTPSKSHNPFVVNNASLEDKPNSPVCTNRSLLKLLSPHKNTAENNNSKVLVDVKSRFFAQNIKQVIKKPYAARDLTEEMVKIEEKSKQSLEVQQRLRLYDLSPKSISGEADKNQENEISKTKTEQTEIEEMKRSENEESHTPSSNSTKDEIVEIFSDEGEDKNCKLFEASQESQQSTNTLLNGQRRLGLSKPRKTQPSSRNNKKICKNDSQQSTLSMFGFQKRPTIKKI